MKKVAATAKRNMGIAAIEMMAVVVIILAAATALIPLFLQKNPVDRINLTQKKLNAIKKAIIGEAGPVIFGVAANTTEILSVNAERVRSAFGFVGDNGSLPTNLDELFVKSGMRHDYVLTTVGSANNAPFYWGWRGPYLDAAQANGLYVAKYDAWGNQIQYAVVGTWGATLTSYGPDGAAGGGDDIVVSISAAETSTTTLGGNFYQKRKPPYTAFNETRVDVWYRDGLTNPNRIWSLSVTYGAAQNNYSFASIFPIGSCYLEATPTSMRRLATIKGNNAVVNFYKGGIIPVIPAGTQLLLSFDSNLTADTNDQGNHNTVTAVGNVAWNANGMGDGAAVFSDCTATNLTYIRVADNNALDLTTVGSIGLWINMANFRQFAGLLHKGTLQNFTDEAYSLQFWNDNSIYLMINNNTWSIGSTAQNWAANWYGKWRFITVTWSASGMKFYIDGVLNASNATVATAPNTTGALIIGAQLDSDLNGYFNIPFCGSISDVAVYKRELSAAEILAWYNSYF